MSAKSESEKTPTSILGDDKKKTCFVMMPIADVEGYVPGHFGRVYEHIIKPACIRAGFEPTIASQVKAANVIIVDILERILNADMVVCDISARNPNVLYELGIRQSFDLPVTLIKDEITRDIFDIQGIRYMPYSRELRVDQIDATVNLLAESIIETYAAKDKGIFSLVQILGRDKAQIKPTSASNDTIIILEALKEIRSVVNRNYNQTAIHGPVFSDRHIHNAYYEYKLKFSGQLKDIPIKEVQSKLKNKHAEIKGGGLETDPLDGQPILLFRINDILTINELSGLVDLTNAHSIIPLGRVS